MSIDLPLLQLRSESLNYSSHLLPAGTRTIKNSTSIFSEERVKCRTITFTRDSCLLSLTSNFLINSTDINNLEGIEPGAIVGAGVGGGGG